MSTRVPARRYARRNSMDDNRQKNILNIDLNSPTSLVENCQPGAAPPVPQRRTVGRVAASAVQHSSQPIIQQQAACAGLSTSPIDVEEIEEEVEFVSSIRRSSQSKTYSRRSRPVIIDEDSDNDPQGAGLSLELCIMSVDRNMGPPRFQAGQTVIDCDALSSEENIQKKRARISCPEPPPPEVPKESNFTCPVCLNVLAQPASTICGHIFCQSCIQTTVQVQKKCPTCRRKLTMKNFHRIYLPTSR